MKNWKAALAFALAVVALATVDVGGGSAVTEDDAGQPGLAEVKGLHTPWLPGRWESGLFPEEGRHGVVRRRCRGPHRVLPADAMEHDEESDAARSLVAKWIAEHRDAMVHVAIQFSGAGTDAQDVVQDASIVALGLAPSADMITSPRGWLMGITRNVGRRLLTKRMRRAAKLQVWRGELQGRADADLQRALAGYPNDMRDHLFGEVRRLPKGPRSVVVRMMANMDDHEIAEDMEVTRTTVRSYRFRAIRTLAAILSSP